MNREDVREIVTAVLDEQERRFQGREDAIVAKAVLATLDVFGVDPEDKDEVKEIKADFQHTRRWRKSVEKVSSVGLTTAVTVLVTGALGALWLGFKGKLGM
jgi:hypothetical protein